MPKNFFQLLLVILFLNACSTINPEFKPEITQEPEQEEFVVDDQLQEEQEFEILEDESQAEVINEEITEEIEEVEVPDRVFFALDSSSLDEAAKSVLNIQAEWLKNDKSINIIIEGHCDERGTREYNIALGEKRALSVKNYLISKDIDAKRIKVISYGKERPAFVGSGDYIWSKNRRSVTVVQE